MKNECSEEEIQSKWRPGAIPLVSICSITYNHENYIKAAIKGFLMQKTTFPFEVIIHDDASTDKTTEILKKYERDYPNMLNCFYQTQNQYSKGVRGIMAKFTFPHARGKYIALCEGDDYWTDPYKLQKQVDFLEANPDFCICFHEVKILKEGKLYDNNVTRVPKKITSIYDLSKGNYIITASSVFRNVIKAFPASFTRLNAGDYPLHLLLSRNGSKIFFIDECMGVYRFHPGGVYTNADPIKLMEGNIVLLSVLANYFKDNLVKKNLRLQLRNVINALFTNYINKGYLKYAFQVIIKNPFFIERNNYRIILIKLKNRILN